MIEPVRVREDGQYVEGNILVLMQLWNYLERRAGNEDGATMVEYGIMVAVIAVVVMIGAGLLGVAIDQLFDDVTASL